MFAELLYRRIAPFVQLSDVQLDQLQRHFELLGRWNRVLNLTSLKGEEEIVERHYCEALFLGAHLPPGSLRIADIGTGAGFPGIPVAILRPECPVTLIESHQRKSVFLREATRDLPNVQVLGVRAEHVKEWFDWAISRAVKYLEIRKTLAKISGHVALLAGENDFSRDSCFTWNTKITVPWGSRRFLWIGSNVSRETLC